MAFNAYVPTVRTVKQSCKLASMLMPKGDTWLYDVRQIDSRELDRAVIFIYNGEDRFQGYI